MGSTTPINGEAADEFLKMIKRVSSSFGRQFVIEIFKQHFCSVCGDYYASSSSLSWAESDLERHAKNAEDDAPGFIGAVSDAFEELRNKGTEVPDRSHVNNILANYHIPFTIVNNELIESGGGVATPIPEESISITVARALSDAKSLIGTADASSAIDRAHTALHGYLLQLCNENSIELPQNPTASKAFKSLRKAHPALKAVGPRSDEVSRVLQSFAASIDAFSTLRNQASLAHANELLDTPEATAIVNAMYTVFRYIQDCMQRNSYKNT
jgi:Abortive infection C-terminus